MEIGTHTWTVESLFSNSTFYIDFYQRQYKWTKKGTEDPVGCLLDDIFYKFNTEHSHYMDSALSIKDVISKYSWYYLNTIVINEVDGRKYLVDGQQRLTTLTLILMKLLHMADVRHKKYHGWIEPLISGFDGEENVFRMHHSGCLGTMKSIFDEGDAARSLEDNLTSRNMVANYHYVSARLERELPTDDERRFCAFVYYFLKRVHVVSLQVEQTEVPMVFEVINDRGVRLLPYEILKGTILSQIDKVELDELGLNELWDAQVEKLNQLAPDLIDIFFPIYLKAKFSESAADRQRFEKRYNRTILEIAALNIKHNPTGVKVFLQKDFTYYTNLYARLVRLCRDLDSDFPYVYYNAFNDQGMQFQLILSACNVDDPDEDAKINAVSWNVDRAYCLAKMQRGCYESNEFGRRLFAVSMDIRGKGVLEINAAFDKMLLELLRERENDETITSIWNYSYFKDMGYRDLSKPFLRYVLARLENYLCKNTQVEMRQTMYNLIKQTHGRDCFHVEHILAHNDENLKLFDNDPDRFENERNRFGGLLLLKGSDNQGSGKEGYSEKLKTYASSLVWNETLREDTYHNKHNLTRWIADTGLQIRAMNTFGPKELEERHKTLFAIISLIWSANVFSN